MKKSSTEWISIGTVLGDTNIDTFFFNLKNHKAKKGDIVTTESKVPTEEGKVVPVTVWGKITSIESTNQFFPREAAQELTNSNIDIRDTILPTTRDELICKVLILGYTNNLDVNNINRLLPLNYPVRPAANVKYPASEEVQKMLITSLNSKHPIFIGSLLARAAVKIRVDADNLVSRHFLITGMSGSGKTVFVRRLIAEMLKLLFPCLVLDIHGDYLGFVQKQKKFFPNNKIKLFYPKLSVNSEDKEIIYTLIQKLGKSLTDPQNDYLNTLLERIDYENGASIVEYINLLVARSRDFITERNSNTKGRSNGFSHFKASTMYVVTRSLREVSKKLVKMEQTNFKHRNKMKNLNFEELPDPVSEPEKIISKGQLSILYLKGYESLPASAIVSILLEALFSHRQEIQEEIPPFLTIIEEAHNFIPSRAENKDNLPSVDTIRRLISEGRKFGTGIAIVSQQPNRLDSTIVAQCNSQIFFRIKNQSNQRFVRETSEYADKDDTNQLPNLANGQAIICGQIVNFSLPVQIQFDEHLLNDDIGNEDFISTVDKWNDKESVKQRKKFAKAFSNISDNDIRRPH